MDANRVAEYIKALKERKNMTTKALSDATNIPEDTINNILYARTQSPAFASVCTIIKALGGSLDELVGIAKPVPVTQEPSGMQLALEYQKQAYESQIENLKEVHAAEIEALDKVNMAHNKTLHIIMYCLFALIAVLLGYILGINIYDLTHPDRGWFQYDTAAGTLYHNHRTEPTLWG